MLMFSDLISRPLLTLCLLILLTSCGRIQNERFTTPEETPTDITLDATLTAQDALYVGQPATLEISLMQKDEPVSAATIKVQGNMSHAGMEPVETTAQERAPGEYEATVEWTMGGDWVVTIQATLPDGSTIEKTLSDIQVNSE